MSVVTDRPAGSPAAAAAGPVSGYRWVVLGAFMSVNLAMQTLWISYASVADRAARYFGVGHVAVGLLAMVFMIVFVPLALPASWAIDRFGFKRAVGAGSLVMTVGALARGLAGHSYAGVLMATIAIAAAQPLLINAWTTMPARWMAAGERATAVGLVTLSNLVGIAVGEAITPVLAEHVSLASVQLVYGALAAACTAVFVLLARERPAASGAADDARSLVLDGLRHALGVRAFVVYLAVWFAGMGIFNGVLTWVDDILRPRGFSSGEAGIAGALVLVGGVIGSVALAPLSDRSGRRVGYMVVGLVLAVPGLLGFTFAPAAWLLDLAAFALGFFLVSVGPVGMQYAAEVTRPTPEATTQGVLQLVGQSSVALVYLMTLLKSGDSFTPALLVVTALLVVGAVLVSRLGDPRPVSEGGPTPGGALAARTEDGGGRA